MAAGKFTEKRRKRKARTVAAKPVARETGASEPVDMGTLRAHLSDMVCAGAVGMVRETVARAEAGQYQAMKYLFEMVGLFPATAVAETPQEDSLAGMLLNRLGIGDEKAAEGGSADHVK
jgi:hypothetical protein